MTHKKLLTGMDFGKALCKHFGLDANQVDSDYKIKTEPGGAVSIALNINLAADDLAGIARHAAPQEARPQEVVGLTIKVDTSGAIDEMKKLRDELNAYAHWLRYGLPSDTKPDHRLNEIVALLKLLVRQAGVGVECRASAPGLHGGMGG